MALLPTGSNKVLEIHSFEVDIVIKAKKARLGSTREQDSTLLVSGERIHRIYIPALEKDIECEEAEFGSYEIGVPPLFFEQTDYELIVKSRNGGKAAFWNENYGVR